MTSDKNKKSFSKTKKIVSKFWLYLPARLPASVEMINCAVCSVEIGENLIH